MRIWYKYIIKDDVDKSENILDFTNQQLAYDENVDHTYYFEQDNNIVTASMRNFLMGVLKKSDKCLSIASGRGENEVGLVKNGYDIEISDINPQVISNYLRLFPGHKASVIDILKIEKCNFNQKRYDALFIPSLLYILNDQESAVALDNMAKLLKPNGKLYLTIKSRDTWFTKLVDEYLCVIDIYMLAIYYKCKGRKFRICKAQHGYRRSLEEIITLVSQSGFRLDKVNFALYSMEATGRLTVLSRLKITKALSMLVGHQSPHLNFFTFSKI